MYDYITHTLTVYCQSPQNPTTVRGKTNMAVSLGVFFSPSGDLDQAKRHWVERKERISGERQEEEPPEGIQQS